MHFPYIYSQNEWPDQIKMSVRFFILYQLPWQATKTINKTLIEFILNIQLYLDKLVHILVLEFKTSYETQSGTNNMNVT